MSSSSRVGRLPHQACFSRSGARVVLKVARKQRPVPFELTQHVTPKARVLLQEVAHPEVAAEGLGAPALRHPCAKERHVLHGIDERVVLHELALVPQQPVELARVELPEPAVEHELLRRRDRRDRVHLEEAEMPDRLQDVRRGAVE